jgi:hypothetical protein
MAKMQIGRGRIQPELDSQRAAVGKFRRQLSIGDYFDRVTAEPSGLVSGLVQTLDLVLVSRQSQNSV